MTKEFQAQLGGVIRHVLTVAAGALAAHGIVAQSDVEPIAAAVTTLIVVVWSVLQKKKS